MSHEGLRLSRHVIGGIKAWLKKVSYGHPMSSLNIEEVTTVEQQDRGHEVPITPGGVPGCTHPLGHEVPTTSGTSRS